MPHYQLNEHDLEVQFPSLVAVEDNDIVDLARLEDESLYAAGMKVVQDIIREMSEVGRTRCQDVRTRPRSAGPVPAGLAGGVDLDRPAGPVPVGHPKPRNSERPAGLVPVGHPETGEDKSGCTAEANGVHICTFSSPNSNVRCDGFDSSRFPANNFARNIFDDEE